MEQLRKIALELLGAYAEAAGDCLLERSGNIDADRAELEREVKGTRLEIESLRSLDDIFAEYPYVRVEWDVNHNEYKAVVGPAHSIISGGFFAYGYAGTSAQAIRSAADEAQQIKHVDEGVTHG
ncbi:hypothetical protein ACTP13_19555 [Paenibacillus peoriae]|uniref:hypothetical protein n=1 Tax=Paenibacillus peoriae TaxID=59893 RepID=UPI003F9CEEA2